MLAQCGGYSKWCHLLLVALVTKAAPGPKNLWKGDTVTLVATILQQISQIVMKTFLVAALMTFPEKKRWHQECFNKVWQISLPMTRLGGFSKSFDTFLFDSYSCLTRWWVNALQPRSCEISWLPNRLCEPCKPALFGSITSMWRSRVEHLPALCCQLLGTDNLTWCYPFEGLCSQVLLCKILAIFPLS